MWSLIILGLAIMSSLIISSLALVWFLKEQTKLLVEIKYALRTLIDQQFRYQEGVSPAEPPTGFDSGGPV